MAKGQNSRDKFSNLRDRAEAFLTKTPSAIKEILPQDVKNLVEELQIHQVELEMQNEELRRAQLELEEARDRFSDLYEFAPVGYFTISYKGLIQEANLRGATMLGVERRQLIGQPFTRFITADTQDVFYHHRQKLIETRSKQSCELRLMENDGPEFHAQLECVTVEDDEGNIECFRAAVSDIQERKRAEEEKARLEDQLQRVNKMEALGLMAGGVAHDLNNILSGIVSYPELLLLDLPEDSPLRNPIKTIQESGMRAADVVEDLLTIAKGVASRKEVLNLNTIVSEYLDSAEYLEQEKNHSFVDLKTKLDPDLLNVNGSSTHMMKTLMNLVVNALEAIEGSGTVIISTANRYLDEPLKGYEEVRTGEYAVLIVSDDGSGISPEDLERIFEPFYTKRVMGRVGTGLGLAVVWNTMQDHDGYINVKSSEKGTVFELYFPVTREEVAAEKEEVPLENYFGHGEKILVVDDEERQREIASGILTRLDYAAEAVSSGEEAIEYVKEQPVVLILLDMVMPKGINGRETYQQIIKICPGQKAIIASGYAKTKAVDIAQKLGAGKYIKKPYTLEKIGIAVKKELQK